MFIVCCIAQYRFVLEFYLYTYVKEVYKSYLINYIILDNKIGENENEENPEEKTRNKGHIDFLLHQKTIN